MQKIKEDKGREKVYSVDGLDIYVAKRYAKRNGKDRIWIQVRQNGPKKIWRQDLCLAYSKAVDIAFTK